LGLLIALLAILLLYKIRKVKPQVAGYGIAEDVPVLRVNYVSIKSTLPGVW
jgi:hypothetical protein